MNKFFKTITFFVITFFVTNAMSYDMGGNQIMPDYGMGNGIQLGGNIDTMGSSYSNAEGWGGETTSTAYTFSDGSSSIDTAVNLTSDQAVDCTECGDNRITLKLQGMQFNAAGSQNNTASEQGGAGSYSESGTWAGTSGHAFGAFGKVNLPQ